MCIYIFRAFEREVFWTCSQKQKIWKPSFQSTNAPPVFILVHIKSRIYNEHFNPNQNDDCKG